eukprot:scaffold102952_cov63-Phaeocystis_antarctica.AAC.2
MQQLLLSARSECGCPMGCAAHSPVLNPSGFQCASSTCGRSLARLRCTSDTVTSPRSSSPHARKRWRRGSARSSCECEAKASENMCSSRAGRHEEVHPREGDEVGRDVGEVRVERSVEADGCGQVGEHVRHEVVHGVEGVRGRDGPPARGGADARAVLGDRADALLRDGRSLRPLDAVDKLDERRVVDGEDAVGVLHERVRREHGVVRRGDHVVVRRGEDGRREAAHLRVLVFERAQEVRAEPRARAAAH